MKFKLILLITLLSSSTAFALGPLKFGFQVGLSTPSDQLSNVYNINNATLVQDPNTNDEEEFGGELLSRGVDNGYHIGVNVRIDLPVADLSLIGSFMYNSFPEARTMVADQITGENVVELVSSQRVVPVSAGLMYNLFELWILEFYLRGEAQLNYFSHETSFNLQVDDYKLGVPFAQTDSYTRFGYGIGAGFDIDLELTRLNLDIRYHTANFIGREDDEDIKTYLSLGVGVYF